MLALCPAGNGEVTVRGVPWQDTSTGYQRGRPRAHLGRISPPDGLWKRVPLRVCGPLVPSAERGLLGLRGPTSQFPETRISLRADPRPMTHGLRVSAEPGLTQTANQRRGPNTWPRERDTAVDNVLSVCLSV